MEADRYQQNHMLYIFGMICLSTSLAFLLFSFFTFPHLLFGWHYDVPEFITFWRVWLISNFAIGLKHASWIIAFILFIAGLLFGVGAYTASTRIDNAIYGINNKSSRVKHLLITSGFRASMVVFLQIIAIVAALYVGLLIVEALVLNMP